MDSSYSFEALSDIENTQEDSPRGSYASWLSNHFENISSGSIRKRRCLAEDCGKEYVHSSSHATLRRHWTRSHDVETPLRRTNLIFHDSKHNDMLVRFIIDTHSEYSLIDKPSFRDFISSLESGKSLICARTLSRLIEGKTEDLKILIKQNIADELSILLTFDIWSPKKGASGFGCVSAHFIDSDWNLRSIILEFRLSPHPHDAHSIRF